MLPLQLLFLDLITDFPLISISTDGVNKEELKKPLHYDIKDISIAIFVFGFICLPFDFMIFKLFKTDPATLQTCWFIESGLKQLVLIFSLRTKMPFWKSPYPSLTLSCFCLLAIIIVIFLPQSFLGHNLFQFVQPKTNDMLLIFSIILGYFVTTEGIKLFYYRNNKK
jgi:Mg2+-importing ATPase